MREKERFRLPLFFKEMGKSSLDVVWFLKRMSFSLSDWPSALLKLT
jgi:hypothetical protein